MTGCLHESPLGDGAHPKVVLFPKEKEVADRATGALCPFPPSGPHHSCHLSFQAHWPCLPGAALGLKAGPMCMVKTRAFPGE